MSLEHVVYRKNPFERGKWASGLATHAHKDLLSLIAGEADRRSRKQEFVSYLAGVDGGRGALGDRHGVGGAGAPTASIPESPFALWVGGLEPRHINITGQALLLATEGVGKTAFVHKSLAECDP